MSEQELEYLARDYVAAMESEAAFRVGIDGALATAYCQPAVERAYIAGYKQAAQEARKDFESVQEVSFANIRTLLQIQERLNELRAAVWGGDPGDVKHEMTLRLATAQSRHWNQN